MDYQRYKELQQKEIDRLEKLSDYYYKSITDDDKALSNYLKVSSQKLKIVDYRLITLMEKYEKRLVLEIDLARSIAFIFHKHFPGTPENRERFKYFIDEILEKIDDVANRLKTCDVDTSHLEEIRSQCFYQNDDLSLPGD